jgi:hypothetical protein
MIYTPWTVCSYFGIPPLREYPTYLVNLQSCNQLLVRIGATQNHRGSNIYKKMNRLTAFRSWPHLVSNCVQRTTFLLSASPQLSPCSRPTDVELWFNRFENGPKYEKIIIHIMAAHTAINTAIDRKLRSTSICFVQRPGLPCAKLPSNVEAVLCESIDLLCHSRCSPALTPFLCLGSSAAPPRLPFLTLS